MFRIDIVFPGPQFPLASNGTRRVDQNTIEIEQNG